MRVLLQYSSAGNEVSFRTASGYSLSSYSTSISSEDILAALQRESAAGLGSWGLEGGSSSAFS